MNIMEALIESETKGTIQEQADTLCDKLYSYKKLLGEYNRQIQNVDDDELLNELYLMRSKYKVRLDYVKKEMVILNYTILDTFKVIEEFVKFDDFVELFSLNASEIDKEESFYVNLMLSSNNIGHIVRTGLIESEKYYNDIDLEG